jgi:hypothetical protein
VNILDANIVASQREQLVAWGVRVRQIGRELGHRFDPDANIIPLLRNQKRATFFTRDRDFWDARLSDSNYCIVWLDVPAMQAADYIRRFLRHPQFSVAAKRLGKVIQVRPTGLAVHGSRQAKAESVEW